MSDFGELNSRLRDASPNDSKKWRWPSSVTFDVEDAVTVTPRELTLSATLNNASKRKAVVLLSLVSSEIPGGTPFTLDLLESQEITKKAEPPEPPAPPRIVKLVLEPGQSVEFTSRVQLDRYLYEGRPTAKLRWRLASALQESREGGTSLTLPERTPR